jgi:hypothetical protein
MKFVIGIAIGITTAILIGECFNGRYTDAAFAAMLLLLLLSAAQDEC